MGTLTGHEIKEQMASGRIVIDPRPDPGAFNPNSVNLRLHPKILKVRLKLRENDNAVVTLDHSYLNAIDSRDGSGLQFEELDCTDGLLLEPRCCYLASTVEEAGSDFYKAVIDGRSSGGRMFMPIHITAGYGDLGFKSQWTLEIAPNINTVVWAYQYICQISFEEVTGKIENLYSSQGRYSAQDGPVPSKGLGDPKRFSYDK